MASYFVFKFDHCDQFEVIKINNADDISAVQLKTAIIQAKNFSEQASLNFRLFHPPSGIEYQDHEVVLNGSLVIASLHFAVMGHIEPINSIFFKLPQISAAFQEYNLQETCISVQDFLTSVIPDNHDRYTVLDYIHGTELCSDHMLMSCDVVTLKESIAQGVAGAYTGLKMSTQLVNYKSLLTQAGGSSCTSVLETLVSTLNKAGHTVSFRGYKDAVTAIFRLFNNSGLLIIGDDIASCHESLDPQLTNGVVINRVDVGVTEKVKLAINSFTKLVWVESPTRLQLTVPCIKALSEAAHQKNALLLVDNSLFTPVLSRPLEHGADMVLHSDCKLSARGRDSIAFISTKSSWLKEKLNSRSATPVSSLDSETLLEEIKTMPLRVLKQQENAHAIASFLSSHFLVKHVYYLGLPSHIGREIHFSQSDGAGSILSFLTVSPELSQHVLKTTTLFAKSGVFGGIKSIMILPEVPTSDLEGPELSTTSQKEFFAIGLKEGLICVSVGIEDVTDLIYDLDQALTSGPL